MPINFPFKPRHLRIVGWSWVAACTLVAFQWTFFILLSQGHIPWVWEYIEPGLGGLGLLLLPNLFYFGLATMLEGETSASGVAERRGFYWVTFLVTTVGMLYGFHEWIDGILDFYHSGFRMPEIEDLRQWTIGSLNPGR